jgi:teichuronic acid biosynthesis glycosyltransferase TuaC
LSAVEAVGAGAAHDVARPLRVLVLSRSYPSDVFPTMGLWVERPTTLLVGRCDVRLVSPVPYCPPLPVARRFTQFRSIPRTEVRAGVRIERPRFLVGPGNSTRGFEARSYHRAVGATVERLWREQPFDLIHAHFAYADGVVASRLARRFGVPFLITEHAPWQMLVEHRSIRRQIVPAAQQASALLAVSNYVRYGIRAEIGDSARISILPVGVDPELFTCGHERARRADQILFVGFPNRTKGVDVLLHAMAELRRRHVPARLLLVGAGHYRSTQREEVRNRRLTAELALGGAVEFLGSRPPTVVAELMRQSALVVLPSRAETFGSVLVEALACGTPVVATRCGGPEDIVTDEVGLLVPPDDPLALADALGSVLSAAGRYPARALREYAVTRFDWSRIADRLLDEYAAAVARARRESR